MGRVPDDEYVLLKNRLYRPQKLTMPRLISLIALALALAGCAVRPPEASGAFRVLNPGRWQPVSTDLHGPETSEQAYR